MAEMIADLDRDDSVRLLDEAERMGAVTRSPSPAGDGIVLVRLTAAVGRRMDEYLRGLTDELAWRLDGVAPEQLPAVRDACWRIAMNLPGLVSSRQ
ncbi:hypothetical protein ABZ783_34335 [Micromonospora sp. NPDC047738]|uniref:hypothetical protein n=1 Tax=Micromonospora sp. NPDC047738 TaxID=3155741 RepID=UPI0033C024D5